MTMGYLRHVLRLSRRCVELEDRLLRQEYSSLLSDDLADGFRETELKRMLAEASTELGSVSRLRLR